MSEKSDEIRERHGPITKDEASKLLVNHLAFTAAGGQRATQWSAGSHW